MDKTENSLPGAKGSGITLDDCEKVTDFVGAVLDTSDLLTEAYVLEVSSPGINRPLKKEADYRRFIGQKAKISLYAPLSPDKNQKNFAGLLVQCSEGMIEIDDITSGRVKIPLASVAKANLDII